MITELIDKQDTSEIVRDEIAAILLAESVSQQALATTAGEDPELWKLRVFLERSNPWSEFRAAPDQATAIPIINVALDNVSFDPAASNVVEHQKANGVFHVECYGYGVSQDVVGGGHIPGDERAALECQRAVRLVRNILMAAEYTYLGLRKTVWKRWIQSIQFLQPPMDAKAVQQIVAARISFRVGFSEYSPQVPGEALELVASTVNRAETGEIYFTADWPQPPPP